MPVKLHLAAGAVTILVDLRRYWSSVEMSALMLQKVRRTPVAETKYSIHYGGAKSQHEGKSTRMGALVHISSSASRRGVGVVSRIGNSSYKSEFAPAVLIVSPPGPPGRPRDMATTRCLSAKGRCETINPRVKRDVQLLFAHATKLFSERCGSAMVNYTSGNTANYIVLHTGLPDYGRRR